VTLRLSEELARRLKQAAAEQGQSVNSYAARVLGAAVDPELAGDEAARVRERLARAELLAEATRTATRPDVAAVRRARKRAGRGRQLSDIVAEDRR
jgi:hypothetical protein